MNIFVKAMPAPKPKTSESQQITYAYAAVLVALAVAQLFTFDKFLLLLESYGLPGGIPVAHLLGGIVVASEVLALPFLLQLKLSHLMRVVSMVLGWLVPLMWLMMAFWLIFIVNAVSNLGLLGTLINLLPGWWTVFICIALMFMAAWASWGMWPFVEKAKKRLKIT